MAWGLLGFLISFFLACFSISLFVLLVYMGSFGAIPSYPDLENIQNNTASEVYSEDGVLLGKYYIQNRVNADYDELSPFLLNALVATEDARFFEHRGVDFRAMMRVLFKSILLQDDSAGGGSTLSQQLAKNLYGRREKGFLALPITKVKEIFTARRLEKIYTKEELLKIYLNTVPFGDNVFGVKVAAQRFFNTSPADITVENAATLIGMLKANTRYNPIRNPELAIGRRNTVLEQMAKYEYLTPSELDSLIKLPIEVKYSKEGHNQGLATYFREHIRSEIDDILKETKKSNGKPYNLYTDGLKVYTTINADYQTMAETAVQEQMIKRQKDFDKDKSFAKAHDLILQIKKNSKRYKKLKATGLSNKQIDAIFNKPVKMTVFSWNEIGEEVKEMSPMDSIKYYLSILNAGFMVMQPQTGKVQAWVGGINQKYFQYDHVKAKRQVGSTFKPLVYAEALRQDFQPCDYLYNRLVTYTEYQDWQPQNADGKYGGLYSMKGGLSNSVNAVTVDLIMKAGIPEVIAFAKQLGIESEIPEVPSIALGTPNLSLLEMVRAYGTFANQGKTPTIYYLTKIENSKGEVIYEAEQPKIEEFIQTINEEDNGILTNMLQAVVDSGTARRLRFEFGLENEIAGKTGTTQDQSDGWFMGYTPNMVAGAWVGAEYPVIHWKSLSYGQGARTALPLWGAFTQKLYAHPKYKHYQNALFTPLTSEQKMALDCPVFLESEDLLVDDQVKDGSNVGDIVPIRKGGLKKNRTDDVVSPDKVKRTSTTKRSNQESEASRRIRERNEKIRQSREKAQRKKQRREKTKGFFDRLLKKQQ